MESDSFQAENPMRKKTATRKKNNNKKNNKNNARKTKKLTRSLAAYKAITGKKKTGKEKITVEEKKEEPVIKSENNNNNNNNNTNASKLKKYTPEELKSEEILTSVPNEPLQKNTVIFESIFQEGDEKLNFPKIDIKEAKSPFEKLLVKIKEKTKENTPEAKAFAELYAKIFVYMYILAQYNNTEENPIGELDFIFQESNNTEINLQKIFNNENIEKLQEAIELIKNMDEQVKDAYFLIKPKSEENPEYKEQLIDSKDLLVALPKVREIL